MMLGTTRPSDSNSNKCETVPPLCSSTDAVDLEQVYVQYMGPIYRFLYSRVGNREDAEDLVAETFLKASRQLDLRRTEATIASWLYTVARTVLADHWRRYYRHAAPLSLDRGDIDPVSGEVVSGARQRETEHRIASILEALPERYRRVLELRFLRGYSVLETAREMGVTPENAKTLQHRALAKAVDVVGDSAASRLDLRSLARHDHPGLPESAA